MVRLVSAIEVASTTLRRAPAATAAEPRSNTGFLARG